MRFMLFINRSNSLLFKVFKFLVFGGAGFASNIVILYLLTDIAGLWYLLSSIISFICSVSISFTLHKFFTFKNNSLEKIYWQGSIFLAVSVFNLFVNTSVMYLGVTIFGFHYLFFQITTSAIIAVWSFYLYTFLFGTRTKN